MKLSEIVVGVEGMLVSDGEFETMNYCTAEIEETFLTFMEKEKFIDKMNPFVTCVLCTEEFASKLPAGVKGVFVTEEPKYCFHKLYQVMNKKNPRETKKTVIGQNCNISPLAYVPENNVVIGDNVVIEPFVYVGEYVTIGDNCVVHANSMIGSRSFSPARSKDGLTCGLENMGQVIIDHDVEICSGTLVEQGIWKNDVTYIGAYSMTDAQCHVGHGAHLGNGVFIAAQSVIGGNTKIGDNTWVGINATISNRLVIGANARVNLGAVVTKDVEDGVAVSGNFAIEHRRFIEHIKKISNE